MVHLASLLVAAGAATLAAAGFYDTCSHDWILGFGGYSTLIADSCPDDSGASHASFINLQDCITNTEGVLSGKPGGQALYSCSSCSKVASNITCTCSRTFGGPVSATLDLNTVINNDAGILWCFDYPGIEVKSLQDPPS